MNKTPKTFPKYKTCPLCEFFYFSPGCPGYSELTPGYDATWRCGKRYWNKDDWRDQHDVAVAFATAETCADYTME